MKENLEQYTLENVSEMRRRMLANTVVIGRPLPSDNFHLDGRKPLEFLTGSGTLVRRGEQAGILTAGHVIGNLKKGEFVKMTIIKDSGEHQTEAGVGITFKEVSGLIIRGEGMDKRKKDPEENQLWDPDIVWIGIAEEDAKWIETYTRGIFYNWDKRKETRDQLVGSEEGKCSGMWVCGRINEISQKLFEMGQGCQIHVEVCQVFGVGEAQGPADEWDRFDYRIDLEESSVRTYFGDMKGEDEAVRKILSTDPCKWGGMSGGGIWLLHMDEKDFKRNAVPNFTLVGVVYAEHEENQSGQMRMLRGHGIRSLKRIFGDED